MTAAFSLVIITLLLGIVHEITAEFANPLNYPYVVKIYYDPLPDNPDGKPIKCSGVIYNENYVITSARCAEATLKRAEGKATHDFADFLTGNQIVKRDCSPTDYNLFRYGVDAKAFSKSGETLTSTSETSSLDDGVAIIQTNKPFIFSRTTRAIEIGNETMCKKEGAPLALGGWEEEKKNKLHKLTLAMLKDDECKGKFSKFEGGAQECAKTTKGGKEISRESDAGAPLVRLIKVALFQAPVDLFGSWLCGVLTLPSLKDSDVFYKQTKKLNAWLKENAGPQDKNNFMPID